MRGSYAYETVEKAVRLFEAGWGFKGTATHIGVPVSTVREWHAGWRALGRDWLVEMDVRHDYPPETRLECARSCTEDGMSVIDAMRAYRICNRRIVKEWKALYRKRGAEAFEAGKGAA